MRFKKEGLIMQGRKYLTRPFCFQCHLRVSDIKIKLKMLKRFIKYMSTYWFQTIGMEKKGSLNQR
jgi:hypothetical protein